MSCPSNIWNTSSVWTVSSPSALSLTLSSEAILSLSVHREFAFLLIGLVEGCRHLVAFGLHALSGRSDLGMVGGSDSMSIWLLHEVILSTA